MRKSILIVTFGLALAACGGGESAATTVADSTTTSSTTTTSTTSTTTTTVPEVDAAGAMLAFLQDDFSGTAVLSGSITVGDLEIPMSGTTSGDEDSSESVFEAGAPLFEVSEDITVDGFDYTRVAAGPWIQTPEDEDDTLGEYFKSISELTLDSEEDLNGAPALRYVPDVLPSASDLDFEEFVGDVEAVFWSDLDGNPLELGIYLVGEMEGIPAAVVYELAFSDVGADHEVEAPDEYSIGYESTQEFEFLAAYPSEWDADLGDLADVFVGPFGEFVDITSYLTGDDFTFDEWAQITVDEIIADVDSTITSDEVVQMGPDDALWRIVQVEAADVDEALYIIYATTLYDGAGAIDVIGVYPAGFEDIDYDQFVQMLLTIEAVDG